MKKVVRIERGRKVKVMPTQVLRTAPGDGERRRYPRHPVSWSTDLVVNDVCFFAARAVDVSARGVRVKLLNRELSALLKPGQVVRVKIRLSEGMEIGCLGEIRHVTNGAIGLEIKEGLPSRIMTRAAIEPA